MKFEENVDGPDKTDSKTPDKNIIILHIIKNSFRAMTALVIVLKKKARFFEPDPKPVPALLCWMHSKSF